MKHPLKLRHRIAREMICKLKDHKWVHSKRRRRPDRLYLDDIEDTDAMFAREREDISYLERKQSGNVLWESLAWWDIKCVRCRSKRHDEFPILPWYKNRYRQIKGFFRSFGIGFSCTFEQTGPLWKKIIAAPIVGWAFGFEQNWWSWNDVERHSYMVWPLEVAYEIHSRLSEWVEGIK